MTPIEFLAANPAWFIVSVAILGLLVGSFLNVVIYRLPVMMQREWHAQCHEILQLDPPSNTPTERFDLILPGSRCGQCDRPIKALENIPIISYVMLRGKCAGCSAPISPRYPIIEAVTGILSAVVAWHYGFSVNTAAALFFTWALISLTMIDFDHQLLPDSITLPFLWLGLMLSLFAVFVDPRASIIGAIAGYLSLWSVYWLFKIITGKEGMGHGDFKLLAMLGAWTGWELLLAIILLSSLVGAIVGVGLIILRGRDKNIPIPFGPYLATAGWITLLWGNELKHAYITLIVGTPPI